MLFPLVRNTPRSTLLRNGEEHGILLVTRDSARKTPKVSPLRTMGNMV
jgi:hypothetical protein